MLEGNMTTQNINEYPASIDELLKVTVNKGASDLHLTAGFNPSVRIHGSIVPLEYPALKPVDIENLILGLLKKEQRDRFYSFWELDFSHSIENLARFRGNIMLQRGSISAAFRVVPFEVPNIDTLGLPSCTKRLCNLSRGLILVTGPTGSGKSTTIASMIDYINTNRTLNIVTVEDPIEFHHKYKKSLVRQREVGFDTHSFADALLYVLRHDPDIILVGEMRDLDSISVALTAAETGHLVISTLHTQTAPLTISRIIDVFPVESRDQIRRQLADSLRAVISQQLLPIRTGDGRVLATEVLLDSPAVKNMIREKKEHQLYTAMQTNQSLGMHTMDYALFKLFIDGKITRETAFEYSVDSVELERMINNQFVYAQSKHS